MIGAKKSAAFLAVVFMSFMSVVSLTACQKAPAEAAHQTVLEMEMDANYSPADPFENGRLFCVSEDIETLDAEVYFQMEGESATVEIKDRNADDVLWCKTWDGNVSGETIAVSLNDLQKEQDYVVRFTGTKINHAVVKVSFPSELVQERSRPSI